MNIYILNDINFYGNEYLQLRIRSGSLNKFHLYSNKIIKEFKPDNIDPPIYIREIIKHQHYDLIPEALRRMEQEKSHNGWSIFYKRALNECCRSGKIILLNTFIQSLEKHRDFNMFQFTKHIYHEGLIGAKDAGDIELVEQMFDRSYTLK